MASTRAGHWVLCSVVPSAKHSAETRAVDSVGDLAGPLDDRSVSLTVSHSAVSMVAPMGCSSVQTLAEPMAVTMGRPWAAALSAEHSALTTAAQ